ncbi:MAG: glutamine--fructose-6-phosphate transaminase (isomerizing), partial [Deltaproteobacteria bacterium]|nr:glutamine--fructose-6-phosphate transaminase (isomerizing) [Deltaproteobacteria bacterium]
MCGIVGYVGGRVAQDVILEGLKRLEYRGYDSAGVATIFEGKLNIKRSEGKLEKLATKLKKSPLKGSVGIGHTRWATHGRPTEANAHPHKEGDVAVVHNGIIENYMELREELKSEGAKFKSETDTEILSHLIHREIKKGHTLEDSVRAAIKYVKGTYALAVVSAKEPERIVAASYDCPLVVGFAKNEAVISSDVLAILEISDQAIFLSDGEVVTVTRDSVDVTNLDGVGVTKTPRRIDWSPVMAEKDGYRHFMQKEIFEQPRAVTDTFRGQVMEEEGDIFFEDFDLDLDSIDRIYLIACGTSWHAALVGKFLLEEYFNVPVEVDLASEFRYRKPLVGKNTPVIAISQSGETADTLAAIKEVSRRGAPIISISNVVESSISRVSDIGMFTHAGPEIGVASTKAFTAQLTSLFMLTLYLGRRKGLIDSALGREFIQELVRVPGKIEKVLSLDDEIAKLSKKYFHATDFLYLGRGINYPIALEGALKLKELSYIHAEGYPAGEMKHGPIALVDEELPIVVLAPRDRYYPKILSNMEEAKARGGRIIAIVSEGDTDAKKIADDFIEIPHTPHYLMPIVMTIPLQMLAYHIAVLKGTDVDQPRNLAK